MGVNIDEDGCYVFETYYEGNFIDTIKISLISVGLKIIFSIIENSEVGAITIITVDGGSFIFFATGIILILDIFGMKLC